MRLVSEGEGGGNLLVGGARETIQGGENRVG